MDLNTPLSTAPSSSDEMSPDELQMNPANAESTPAPVRVRPVSVRHRVSGEDQVLSKLGSTEAHPTNKPTVPHAVAMPQPAPLSLVFSDALLEQKFRFYFFHKRLGQVRLMLPLLLILSALLGVYDQFYTPDSSDLVTIRLVRSFGQVLLVTIWLGLTFTSVYTNFSQPINSLCSLIYGAVAIALAIIEGPPDHGSQMLFYFLVYNFIQLRILYATGVCWTLFLVWVLGVKFAVSSYDRLALSAGYMFSTNAALMIACYFIEYWSVLSDESATSGLNAMICSYCPICWLLSLLCRLRLDFVRHHLLILEERKTSDLLATLLPERITEQLRNLIQHDGLNTEDGLIAEDHPNVSILFSDIVGFTAYSSTITAREVVGFLSNLYTILDYLTSEHEVLKVETIGDAYFVASGVLTPREDHATLLANFSFAMAITIKKFKLKGGGTLRMRIGLHSGRVIAGVVGLKVPRYHLFGESVTIASLMEQTGQPDRIQVSSAIASDLSRWTDDRGREMYLLEHRVDPVEEADELLSKRNHIETYWLTDGRLTWSDNDAPVDGRPTTQPINSALTRTRMASAAPQPTKPPLQLRPSRRASAPSLPLRLPSTNAAAAQPVTTDAFDHTTRTPVLSRSQTARSDEMNQHHPDIAKFTVQASPTPSEFGSTNFGRVSMSDSTGPKTFPSKFQLQQSTSQLNYINE